jgi:hypothetical protein
MKVHNVYTNIVGRTEFVVRITGEQWDTQYAPMIDKLLAETTDGKPFSYKAKIGHFCVEYRGNDPHVHEFYSINWPAAAETDVPTGTTANLSGIDDLDILRFLKGIHNEEEELAAVERLKDSLNKGGGKYRKMMRDERIAHIEDYEIDEQRRIMLLSPSAIYCPDRVVYVTINTNYYGEVKTKSSLGPLDDMITRGIVLNETADPDKPAVANPGDVWLSLHAGCVMYKRENGDQRGMVIIAPTGTGKSTNCYGMVDCKPSCQLLADDFAYVNLGSLEVIYSEDSFYMRTNIVENYPHLLPWLVHQPLENVDFSRETLRLLARFETPREMHEAIKHGLATEDLIQDMRHAQPGLSREDVEELLEAQGRVTFRDYDRLIDEMCANPAARSLINPRVMVGEEKFVTSGFLTDIVLGKRDYDDRYIVRQLSTDEAITIMTSQGNVFNYLEREVDEDRYPILYSRTTEIYYDPYLIDVHVLIDPEKGICEISDLDRRRIAAWRFLFDKPQIHPIWFNTRLPAAQSQFSLRKYMEGEIDEVRIIKGFEIGSELMDRLGGLYTGKKEHVRGRREIDLVGVYQAFENGDGVKPREVEVVGYYKGSGESAQLVEAVAFSKKGRGVSQIVAWSGGTVDEFLAANQRLGAESLFSD